MPLPLLLAAADPLILQLPPVPEAAPPPEAAAPAEVLTMPPPIKAMLDAAMASGSEAEVTTVAKYATLAAPDARQAITDAVDHWRGARREVRDRRLREADLLDLWTGRAEVGGFATTGNSATAGGTALLDLTREGLRTRLKLHAQADYAETRGVTTREHYLLAFEPNVKIDDRLYLYGAAQYESDRFFGYSDRLALSGGLGYSALRRAGLTLDVELGPAYRATAFTDGRDERSIAGRGTIDLDWRLADSLTFRQDAAAYYDSFNSTLTSTTALAAKVLGPISAQISYSVQYESRPPEGRQTTDTTSRASLVYSF